MRYLMIPAALIACSSAIAVPYTLPSGPDVAQALLSGPLPSYAIRCDSAAGVPCDVEPGTYQLQVFGQDWDNTKSKVLVGDGVGSQPSGGSTIERVTETIIIDGPDPTLPAVECPAGSTPTGGSCAAWLTSVIAGELQPLETTIGASSAMTDRGYSCPFRGQDGADFAGGQVVAMIVTAACLTP